MNLESQVCALEYAKRLKKLNVKQDSYFYYTVCHDCTTEYGIEEFSLQENKNHGENISAYTSAELLDLLPRLVTIAEDSPFNTFRLRLEKSFFVKEPEDVENFSIIPHYIVNYRCDSTDMAGEQAWLERTLINNICDENCANALAKMLVYLIENGFISERKSDSKDIR
jgi:hypothetical protein